MANKLLVQKRKISQQIANVDFEDDMPIMVKVYVNFRTKKGIKKVLTES